MLAKGPPKKDKNGNIMKDKSGKVVHEPYVIKVLNTINFSKSLHYLSLIHISYVLITGIAAILIFGISLIISTIGYSRKN